MNVHLRKVLLVSAVLTAVNVNAMEISGKKMEIYSKIHMSVDMSDTDNPAITNDGMSVSSNSSRLGLKGKTSIDGDKKIFWKIEQEISMDDSNKGNFANRNSYIGIADGDHSILVGVHDTPFKSVGSKWGVFGDSVAERRSILGASHDKGNQLNERVKNAVMYQFKNKAMKVQAMYAVDPEGANTGIVDDSVKSMKGLGVWYKLDKLKLSFGFEQWLNHSVINEGTAIRLAAVYKMKAHQVGAIYETIDSDDTASANALAFNRTVMGANWKFKFADKTDFRLQYLIAGDADNSTATGATKLGLGIYHKLDKKAKVYVAYASTSNDANAKFQAVDGGHGDEVKTVTGGSPNSLSAGIEYKF